MSVPGREIAAPEAEPSAAEEATQVRSVPPRVVAWPGAAAGAVEVPVPAGRAAPGEVPGSEPVAGVSVLADGAAAAALRPGDGQEPGRAGPPAVAPDAQPPAELGGLAAGGLSRVRIAGQSRQHAEALGAVQVFTVERVDGVSSPGAVDLQVDYSGYAEAFGGNYADRLRLVELPACALTRPSDPSCSAVPVPVEAVNHPGAGTLTARVPASGDLSAKRGLMAELGETGPVSGSVFAVMSSGQGTSTGDYEATDLNPGGTWQVGLSSGAFTYSYPIPEPPLLAGSGLGLSLSYNSQSVDAFTQSTNNQSGWAGLGWDLNPGFIERKFRPCREDIGDGSPKELTSQQHWGDLCWESPDENDGESDTTNFGNSELYLHLNGVSTRIVKDHVSGAWKTEDDFGWEVRLISGGAQGKYWQISTHDSTRYRFGYNDDSNLRVPVVGDDPGEPHYDNYPIAYYETWRWTLDRVAERNENWVTLHWQEEDNHYKRYETGSIMNYGRGSHLQRIEYGFNFTPVGSAPTGKVEFFSMNRCTEATLVDDPVADRYVSSDCPAVNEANASSYPDVPVDLICGASSCGQLSPTFFSTKRLERVTSYRWYPAAQDWRNVFQLQLRFRTMDPAGLTGQVLWLDRIFPVGVIGLDEDKLRLPGVDFNAEFLDGRVDHAETEHGVSRMRLPRVYRVYNGYGGRMDVTYGHVAPCPTSGSATGNDEYWDWYATKVGNWDVNTEDCAPVWFKPEGAPAGWGQFHKFLALKVVETDQVGDSPDVVTDYEYRGDAAWALGYGFIDSTGQSESWNEWRGYPRVRVHTGSGTDPDGYSMTEHTFFRGLYYDYYDDWQTFKQVSLTDYDGNVSSDYPGRAGKPQQIRRYRVTAYDPDPAQRSFTEVSSSRFLYRWIDTGDGPGQRNPRMAQRSYERHRVALDGGGWREESERITAFDSYGLPTEIVDWNVVGSGGDETCTTISYARRDSGSYYLIDFPETVETWDDDTCATANLLSRTVTLYDGRTEADLGSQDPFDGNPTELRTHTSPTSFVASKASYDDYGRVTSVTDPVGETTTTGYDPAVNWPANGITTTNPAGHASTVWLSSATGQPERVIDANGAQTDISYDQLGRPTAVYLPGDPQSAGIASMTFDYQYTFDGTTGKPTAATRVGTHTLAAKAGGGQYLSSYVFDDGYGRVRETQTASPAGGQVVEAVYYDARGLEQAASAPFHNSGTPGAGLVNPATSTLPSWARTEYDSPGRATAAVAMAEGSELWRTTTSYHGDRTMTTPPDGAAPVTVWSDVRGNPTLRQEHLTGGGTVDTSYSYDLKNQLTGVTDDAGNQWSYTYDLAGRKTIAVDPDTGTTTYTYDAAGRVISTVDGRGQRVSTSYDSLGRPASRWHGAVNTGTLAAQWTYDTLAKGQLASATRWHNGDAYTTTIGGYNQRYQPTGLTVSIPSSEGPLSGAYPFSYTYTDVGWAESVTLPAAGGLAAETVTTSYTALGQPDRLASDYGGGATYVHASTYDKTGDLVQQLLGEAGSRVARDLAWDEATGRLAGIATVTGADTAAPTTVQDDGYEYDPAGNVLAVADAVSGQAECFAYDELRRLVEAWTVTTAGCAAGPGAGVVDGPDPYWHSWTFDSVGNRLTQTEHAIGGADEVTTTYAYPPAGGAAPHSLTQKSVTDPSGTVVTGYQYDPSGNTTGRPDENGDQQTLTWDAEGHLAAVSGESGTSEYVYDPDGNRLVAHHADGSAVLYLPGGMEVHANPSGMTSCYRYYGDAAVRTTGGGLSWLAADHHGTGTLAVDAGDLSVTERATDPYGNPRGAVTGGTWPDDKGFLGAPTDPTGLVHLGAREYDPLIGRFISVDPIMALTDPQQMHGYAYANSNPLTFSDPSGLSPRYCTPDADSLCAGQNPRTQPAGRPRPGSGCQDAICRGRNGERVGGGSAPPPRPPAPSRPRRIVNKVLKHGTSYVVRNNGRIVLNGVVLPEGAPPGAELAPLVDQVIFQNGLQPDDVIHAVSWLCQELVIECDRDFLEEVTWADVGAPLGADTMSDTMAIGGGLSLLRYTGGPSAVAPRRGGAGCSNSFEPGTLVLMADGTHKPIEDIQPGDLVLATDPETGRTEPQPVVATITGHGNKTLVEVSLSESGYPAMTTIGQTLSGSDQAGGRHTTVTTTENHPFWVVNRASWIKADDLRTSDLLLTVDGNEVSIDTVTSRDSNVAVYNLTVSRIHTYYVLVDSTPALVHNAGPCAGDEVGLEHAINRHTRGGSEFTRGGAGLFDDGVNLSALARSTSGQIGRHQENGNVIYILRNRGIVGIDGSTGLPTNIYTVVRNPYGELVTLYPGR